MDAGRLFTRSVFASALALGLLGAPTAATAQSNTPPSVRTMPDQETYDGRNMVVWGDFADAQIASGQLYFWTIDFGDGTAPAQGSIRLQSGVLKNEAGTTLNSSPTNVADLSQRYITTLSTAASSSASTTRTQESAARSAPPSRSRTRSGRATARTSSSRSERRTTRAR